MRNGARISIILPMKKENRIGTVTIIYIVLFLAAMLMYAGIHETYRMGEWDDYSLPVVSILFERQFTVDAETLANYPRIFPEWADLIGDYELSGFFTSNGRELTWYFPTYSILCIPMTIALWLMKLPRIYAFSFTNIAILVVALLVVFKCLQASDMRRLLLILLLSIHPAVFYLNYVGAEVTIYSFLIMGAVFWYNRQYHRAAIFVSLAGTMNATVLAVGIVMILEYLVRLFRKERQAGASFAVMIKKNLGRIIGYGCCYIIGIIPMLYNLILTGHINLTASYDRFTTGKETTLERFVSYLFDLNYGMLPYLPVVIILLFVLFILAIFKKHFRYIEWTLTGFVLVMLYAVMVHINSGMDAIARYNVWGSVLFIFAVTLFFDEILTKPTLQKIVAFLLSLDILWSGFIVWWYGPNRADNTAYIFMNPLAVKVLEHSPALYSPLHSTFASRTLYEDGCYEYDTPVVYKSYEDGTVRKVLATSDDASRLLAEYSSASGYDDWWEAQVSKLTEKETYISVPKKYQIVGGEED